MFDKIIEFFTRAQEIKNKRFEEFEAFHIECTKSFPNELKKALMNAKIKPVDFDNNLEKSTGHKHSNWYMGFTTKDIFWWREQYKIDNFTMLPIDKIKSMVKQECLNMIDSMPIGNIDDELKSIYENILDEIITYNK